MNGVRPADSLELARQWWGETLAFFIRPLEIFRTYRLEYVRPDLVAALTMGVVTLPQAIAFALISDLPPQTGLYTAIVASIVGALWGSSIHLNTGPTNTTSLLVLSTLLTVASPGTPEYLIAAALMAVIVGVFRLVAVSPDGNKPRSLLGIVSVQLVHLDLVDRHGGCGTADRCGPVPERLSD